MSVRKDVALGTGDAVTVGERVYFAAVALLAAWVGLPAFLAPSKVTKVLPFFVPPLHARFIGAVYLAGLVLLTGALLARRWSDIRLIPVMTAIWTGGLLVVTLLHTDAFDFDKTQTQVWFGAYVAYPLIGIAIAVRRRNLGGVEVSGTAPSSWVRGALRVQGVVLTVAGAALFLAPGTVADAWPWPVDSLLAQIYSAPILAFGVGSLVLARARTWPEMRKVVIGIGVFGLGALVASLRHRDLFHADDPAAWVWFGALAALTGFAAAAVVSSRRLA